jgi:hypothetical protein
MTDVSVNALWKHYRANVIGDGEGLADLILAAELGFWAGALGMLQGYHQTLMDFHHGKIGVDEVMQRYTAWVAEFDAHSTALGLRHGHTSTAGVSG